MVLIAAFVITVFLWPIVAFFTIIVMGILGLIIFVFMAFLDFFD